MATKDNSIIPITSNTVSGSQEQGVNARDLHNFLQVGRDFATWMKDRIAEYEFSEGEDFVLVHQKGGIKKGRGGDRRSIDYFLTLEMAKELAMVEKNDKGREARRYFIECERRAKATLVTSHLPAAPRPVPLLTDDSERWYLAKMQGGSIIRMVLADEPCAVKFMRDRFPHLEVVTKEIMRANLMHLASGLIELSGQFITSAEIDKGFGVAMARSQGGSA